MTSATADRAGAVLAGIDELERCTSLAELDRRFGAFVAAELSDPGDETAAELVLGALATSAEPEVRARAAAALAPHLPAVWARDLLCGLAVDPDDIVCMAAMRLAGAAGITELAHYLMDIIGPPSRTVDVSVSPVGRGASIARQALLALLRVPDGPADLIAAAERRLRERQVPEPAVGSPPPGFDEDGARRWLVDHALPADDSMVLVPGGTYLIGLDPDQVPSRDFAWERGSPARAVWLPPFLIDRTPVTVGAYDEWTASEAARTHRDCHPLEPADKRHRRNTRLDPRVGATHPVTAVDWFDAAAYARGQGKRLPTEYQWEAAARGPARSVWPWGDRWRPEQAWSFRDTYGGGREPADLAGWRAALGRTSGRVHPARTTAPVDRPERGVNGFGVSDLVGNCWEWTQSELAVGGPYSPTIERFLPGTTSVVIKGGCWASVAGQLYPSFRGQDAPFCRHDEIGFRCVRTIPFAVLRTFVPGVPAGEPVLFGAQVY